MIYKIFNPRIAKFLVGGGIAAAFNLLLMFLFVDVFYFNTSFLRNIANLISIELSLILSFFIYRVWVWPGGNWNLSDVLFRQIPLYHISAGSAILIRILAVFPFLDWLGINYAINSFAGILVGACINYILSDNLVFRTKTNPDSEIYYPEGLASAFIEESFKGNLDTNLRHSQAFGIDNSLTLSILMPAHNEESCIEHTIQSICQVLETNKIDYEVLVVNDNSHDNTEILLQKMSSQNQRVRYVNNYFPNGYGFAVRCGLENYHGDAIAIVMADSSDDPKDLVKYYNRLLEGYDCVFGSRFIQGSEVIDYPFHKLVLNRLGNLIIQILFGLHYNDITNAFKSYRREVIEGISPLISHHFNLTVEMPLKAIARGYSYAIMPINWRNRKKGISKLKIKEVWGRYFSLPFMFY